MNNVQEMSNSKRAILIEKLPIEAQQKVFRSLVLKNLSSENDVDYYLGLYFDAINEGNIKEIVLRTFYLGMEMEKSVPSEYHLLFVSDTEGKKISYIDWTTINYHTDWLSTLDFSDFLFPLDNEIEEGLDDE